MTNFAVIVDIKGRYKDTQDIIVYLSITLSILLCLAFWVLFKSKLKREKFEVLMMKVLTEKKLFRDRHTLILKDIIGQGSYGLVYSALFNDGLSESSFEVAVKTVKKGNPTCDTVLNITKPMGSKF